MQRQQVSYDHRTLAGGGLVFRALFQRLLSSRDKRICKHINSIQYSEIPQTCKSIYNENKNRN